MGKGRKKTPKKLTILRGNPGKRPLPNCPDVENEWIDPPEWMDELEAKEWNNICSKIYSYGYLNSINHASMEIYVVSYCQYRKFSDLIRKSDPENVDLRLVKEWRINMAQFYKQAKDMILELGLTPVAMNKIEKPTTKKEEDPMLEIVKAQNE